MTEKYHSLRNEDLRTKTLSSLKTLHQKLKERNIFIYPYVCWQKWPIVDSFKKITYF